MAGLRLVLHSDRPDEALALLGDGLGLSPPTPAAADGHGIRSVALGDTRIDIVRDATGMGSVTLEIAVDDLDAVCSAISAETDVEPLGPVALPWGARICGVRIPGGPILRLVQAGPDATNPHRPGPPRAATRLAVVSCMEARPDPLRVLGLPPGGAAVITTPGGVVTDDVIPDLLAARRRFGVDGVVVVQHRPCALARRVPTTEDPADALRRSLARLVLPPLRLPPHRVEGHLVGDDGTSVRIGAVSDVLADGDRSPGPP